jgi:hypothetical protein
MITPVRHQQFGHSWGTANVAKLPQTGWKIEHSDREGRAIRFHHSAYICCGQTMRVNSPKPIRLTAVTIAITAISLFAATALMQPAPPSITSLIPSSGSVGTRIIITGSGFSLTGNTVHFGFGGGVNIPATENGTRIVYTIPNAVGPHDLNPKIMVPSQIVSPSLYQIFIVNAQMQSSNDVSFTVTQ